MQMENVKQIKKDLEDQLKHAKEALHENKEKFSKEVKDPQSFQFRLGRL